jgi:hypothetical protein
VLKALGRVLALCVGRGGAVCCGQARPATIKAARTSGTLFEALEIETYSDSMVFSLLSF